MLDLDSDSDLDLDLDLDQDLDPYSSIKFEFTCLFSSYFSIFSDSTDDDDIVIEDSKDIITVKQMMKLFANHPMLESFQLCCQWLMTSKHIIQEAGDNSHVLWHR